MELRSCRLGRVIYHLLVSNTEGDEGRLDLTVVVWYLCEPSIIQLSGKLSPYVVYLLENLMHGNLDLWEILVTLKEAYGF